MDISPLAVSQLFPYFAVILLFCFGKNSWITQRCRELMFFQSVDWTGKHWIVFFGVWIMFCFILGGLLLVSYFAFWNSKIQAIYTEMLFWQQKLYKNLGWASVSSSFFSSGGLHDFRNAPNDCFVQPEHSFLAELFFLSEVALRRDVGAEGQNTVIRENLTVATGFLSHAEKLAFAARMLQVRTSIPSH